MQLTMHPDPVPLRVDAQGVIRFADSRVPLDRVVECYKCGETPECIVDAFDTLCLADVYAAISYYLKHRDEVEAYLRVREARAQEMRRLVEGMQPSPEFIAELRARAASLEKGDAASSQ